MPGPIKVSVLGDVSDLVSNLGTAEGKLKDFEDTADRSSRNVSDSVDNAGGSAAKLGGAVGDLAGGFEAVGLGGFGDQLNKLSPLLMFAAGAADVFTVANESLNLTFLANPIGIVVIAIVALVAIFVVAYKKSETFRNIVNGALHKVKEVAGDVVDWFKKLPQTFGHIFDKVSDAVSGTVDFFKGLPDTFSQVWDKVTGVFTTALDWIKKAVPAAFDTVVDFIKKWTLPGLILGHIDDIKAAFSGLVDFVKGLPNKIGGAATGIANTFINMVNTIIRAWNGLDFGIHVHLPGFLGGFGFDIDDLIPDVPEIPHLARGGITTGPTLALIGDNPGGREAVIPLDQDGGFGNTYHLNVSVALGASPAAVGGEIVKAIQAFETAGGRRRQR